MDARTTGILVVGNYCHDTLLGSDGKEHQVLGGSAAYVGGVLRALGVPFRVLAKVGGDFRHAAEVPVAPVVVEGARTCAFVDDYRRGERVETCTSRGPVIEPEDVDALGVRAEIAIACAVGGEVPARTLLKLAQTSRLVLADAQGLLRSFSADGAVGLALLSRTEFADAAAVLHHLKASRREAEYLDGVLAATVVVTDGASGCRVFPPPGPLRERSFGRVAPFPAVERDATGAGDCFLAGYASGLLWGKDSLRAAQIGAYCGARAVESVGVPALRPEDRAKLDTL